MFEVDAVDLMNVTRVIVGHDDKKAGRGWFLQKACVRVANGDSAGSYWMFPCDRCSIQLLRFLALMLIGQLHNLAGYNGVDIHGVNHAFTSSINNHLTKRYK